MIKINIIDVRNQLVQHPNKTYNKRSLDSIKYIAIHHSATKGGNGDSFARYHVNNNNWPGIGYHYVILADGKIEWTNDLTTVSYHVGEHNSQAIGICLVGDFTASQLPLAQKEALKELCQYLLEKLNLTITDVKGHNEFSSSKTKCPGLDMEQLRAYLNDQPVQIFINNKKMDVTGYLSKGVTYVPLREFAIALGYTVSWDGSNNRIDLHTKDQADAIMKERDYYWSIIESIKKIISKI